MMGVGKSTVGKLVAKKQKMEFVDTDQAIEKKFSMTIAEIFKKNGESFFRLKEEEEVLKSLKKKNCVIALGGGAFINKAVRNYILKNAVSVWLDTDPKILYHRIKWNKKRPLLNENNSAKKINELYLKRKNIYKLANCKINCDESSKASLAKKIITFYEEQ